MTGSPKATAILRLEKGTLYADQRDRSALEPKPAKELKPRCPQRFTKDERRAWRGLAEVLKNYGLFTAANALQLELLAVAWTQYIESGRILADKTKGLLFISDGTAHGFKENPILRTQQRLRAEISTYAQNLGLSSIALARIGSLSLKAKKERDAYFD